MEFRFAKRMDGLSGNAIRDIFKLLSNPEIISFAGGNPAASALRDDFVRELADEVLRRDGKRILQYGATEGYPALLESVAEFVKTAGIQTDPASVLPVTGSTQGMDLLCKVLIDPGDVILVERPTFLGAMHTMKIFGADIRSIEMDAEGVIPEDLEEKIERFRPKFVYLIPTFQNPTGRTLPVERRKRIAQIAAQYQTVILEDDPYRDLRYEGTPLPSIASFDTSGYVVYVASFSKTMSPDMRVGALIVRSPELHRKLVICKQGGDLHTPNLTQAICDAYLRSGKLPQHLKEAIESYRVQMNTMLNGLKALPEGVSCVKPEGGLFIWLDLPKGIDAAALLPTAANAGVAYVAGALFYAQDGKPNSMRLNFSLCTPDKIERGMNILGEVLKNAL